MTCERNDPITHASVTADSCRRFSSSALIALLLFASVTSAFAADAGPSIKNDTADAKTVLADLDKHYPGAKSYEVASCFYWQGEKDAGHPVWAADYEKNLVQLIKALRKEFNAPNAKFVLGTMGESVKDGGNGGKILEAQLDVDGTAGKYPEFNGNVATIYTHDMAQGGSGNGHYGGKAEVYMDVGEAMGLAMVELLMQ